MIVKNQFPEFEDIAKEIDREYYFVNIEIYKDKKNAIPRNEYGKIYIPETNNKDFFAGELTHEVGHSVNDPITTYNYIKALNETRKALNLNEESIMKLGNAISDIINDWEISQNNKLKTFRAKMLRTVFDQWYNEAGTIQQFLWAFYNKIHKLGLGKKIRNFRSEVKQVIAILTHVKDRIERYKRIARILLDVLDDYGYNGFDRLPSNLPLEPNGEDLENTINQIFQDAEDVEEAKTMLRMLAIGKGKGGEAINNNPKLLMQFYQAKANNVRMFVDYPKTIEHKGVKLGSRKWRLGDGYQLIDVKRTMFKFGVNIPLVTTKTPRILEKFISSRENTKPIDIVISIDTSGSTGYPLGRMDEVADYEVIMLYALIDEAKRHNQNIGLTLWSSGITFTTLPKTCNYREVEKLKEIPFTGRWYCGGTNIRMALEQAKQHRDKLFLMFTDGEVWERDLIDVDNVMFFLIRAQEQNYWMFVDKYGENRVVKIDDIENIPKVTLQWFRSVMA